MIEAMGLRYSADLYGDSLEQAILDLFSVINEVRAINPEEVKIITVVCHPANALPAKKAVTEINDVTSNIAFQLRYAEYLGESAWFITEGTHLIFSPGA
jgi:hypothetical protein